MTEIFEAELTVGPRAIEAYSRLSYTMWFALAEFVDNSTQSRLNYGNVIDEVLREEGRPLIVSIVHDRPNRTLTIEDNSIGMSGTTSLRRYVLRNQRRTVGDDPNTAWA